MNSPSDSHNNAEYDFRRVIEEVHAAQKKRDDFFCDINSNTAPKYYVLGMFPYPSGNAHMGHVRVYSLTDVVARYKKSKGFNVLHPLGWDAFGLPAENAAIKSGIAPDQYTQENIERMKNEQFVDMGWSFDMSKEINTSSPDYYKWTQWIFLQFFKHGKAYQAQGLVNWCPEDQTVLANEQVIDGRCWRDNAEVEKKYLKQWFLRLTDYSERLWNDISKLDHWANQAVSVQKNWINQSTGCRIDFSIGALKESVSVFTTRADTLFGVSAIVLAPENPLVQKILSLKKNPELSAYAEASIKRSTVERMSQKEKTGVRTGITAKHPITEKEIEIWAADYVLGDYGTGAVMCVPAHDERDFEFAKKYSLKITEVVAPLSGAKGATKTDTMTAAYVDDGILVNSGEFTGLPSAEAREKISVKLEKSKQGARMITYNLRDWSVGRQRYWGCPIPILHCEKCGVVPVPEKDLPVILPKDVKFENGKADIHSNSAFLNTKCPKCGGSAKRETDTLDTFICSSWYAFRFIDPKNSKQVFDLEKIKKWMPIDFYVGGLEHAALHMIYFRFFTKFFKDIGLVPYDEPVDTFFCNGMVNKDGAKMSKSKGNVVIPTEVISRYGSDALRLYILSDTPAELEIDWDESGITGKLSFVKRAYRTSYAFLETHFAKDYEKADFHSFSQRGFLTEFYSGIQNFEQSLQGNFFHNAVARLHEITNALVKVTNEMKVPSANDAKVLTRVVKDYLIVMGFFAPFMAESVYGRFFTNGKEGIYGVAFPKIDPSLLVSNTVNVVVQINGKKRAVIEIAKGSSQESVDEAVKNLAELKQFLDGKTVRKKIYVADKIYNIVVS